MTSITDLLNKNKQPAKEESKNGQSPQVKIKPKIQIGKTAGTNNPTDSGTGKPKPAGIKLRTPATVANKSNGSAGNQVQPEKSNTSPLAQLQKTLNGNPKTAIPSIKDALGNIAATLEEIPTDDNAENQKTPESIDEGLIERGSGFHNPTLEDVSKFVFDEQPDSSTEEITEKFSDMLDNLNIAVGDEVPSNLAKCLQFVKEHAFLADILKPESIGDLVTAMRKSYGFIVQHKTEKQKKTSKRAAKQNDVLNSLGDLDFNI